MYIVVVPYIVLLCTIKEDKTGHTEMQRNIYNHQLLFIIVNHYTKPLLYESNANGVNQKFYMSTCI